MTGSRKPFIDLGEKELKNIARPVRVYAIKTGVGRPRRPAAAPAPDKAGPPRLSIVVLPFANIGGDPEQEYFVDGVTESLTTDLSRISGSFVIGRNTAFTYKGKHVDLKQIGRELNVRYVLEGSVQRSGNRLRVNVQLIDAESGAHLWAERFDKPVADLFDMQDEIVARLANQLGDAIDRCRGAARGTRTASRLDGPLFSGHGLAEPGLESSSTSRKRLVFLNAPWRSIPANVEALTGQELLILCRAIVLFARRSGSTSRGS